jgi:hypothetical protein
MTTNHCDLLEGNMSEVVSLRLPKGTLLKLKLAACEKSLKEKTEVRWTNLVKEAITPILSERKTDESQHNRVDRPEENAQRGSA